MAGEVKGVDVPGDAGAHHLPVQIAQGREHFGGAGHEFPHGELDGTVVEFVVLVLHHGLILDELIGGVDVQPLGVAGPADGFQSRDFIHLAGEVGRAHAGHVRVKFPVVAVKALVAPVVVPQGVRQGHAVLQIGPVVDADSVYHTLCGLEGDGILNQLYSLVIQVLVGHKMAPFRIVLVR